MDTTPHLAFPLRVRSGRFLTVEQDSREHLETQAELVLRTRPGSLEAQPKLGMRDLVARLSPASPEILTALTRFVDTDFMAGEDESALAEHVRTVSIEVAREEDD